MKGIIRIIVLSAIFFSFLGFFNTRPSSAQTTCSSSCMDCNPQSDGSCTWVCGPGWRPGTPDCADYDLCTDKCNNCNNGPAQCFKCKTQITNTPTPTTTPAIICSYKVASRSDGSSLPSGGQVKPSETIEYGVEARYTSGGGAYNPQLVDALPSAVTYVEGSNPNCYVDTNYVGTNQIVRCNLGYFTPSKRIYFQVKVKDNVAATSYTNTAKIEYSTTSGGQRIASSACAHLISIPTPTPTPAPNLSCFSKSAFDLNTNVILSGGNVAPGQSFRYQIVAENRSTSSISGVYIIDQLPQYIEFVSDGDGGCRVIATTTAGQQVRCEIGSMVGGNSRKTIYFNVKAKTNLPANTNQVDSAQVYPLTTDSNTCTHTVKYQPTITTTPPPPALSCTSKTAYSAGPPFPTGALIPNGANVSRGQQLKYRISYKNNSTTSVSNAYTDDQLPRYIEIPSGTTLPTGCSILPTPTTSTVGQKVRCTIGTVSGGQSGFKEFVARVRTDAPGGSTQLDSAVVQPVTTISNTCTHSVKVAVTPSITITITPTPSKTTPTPTGTQTTCKSYSVHETSGTGSRFLEYTLDPPSILRQLSTFCSNCNVEAMDNHPGTGQVYVVANGESSSRDGRLCILDKSLGALTNCKNIKRTIEGLAFRPSGELWAWKVGEGLYTVDLSTGALTSKATIKNVDVSSIAWNKDGTRLYLSKDGTNLLYEFNPSTGSFVTFNGGSGQGTLGDTDGMDTSPDGWVVGAHKSGGVKLYAYNLGTKRVQQVYSISTSASNWDGMTEMCPLNLSATVGAAALSYPTPTPVPAISYQPVQVSIYNNNSYYQIAVSARRSGTTSFTECFRKAATATQQYGTCSNLSAGQPHDFRIIGLDCSSGTCREITASAQVKTSIVPSLSEVVFHIDLRSFISGPTPTRTPTPRFSPTRTPTPAAGGGGTSVSVIPLEDAHVSSANPTTNYGTSTVLQVDANSNGSPFKITYLKFNLNVSQLIGKTITSVKLRLRISESSSATQRVKLVSTNSWSESTINFSNRPGLGSIIASNTGGSLDTFKEIALPASTIQSRIGQVMSLAMDTSSTDGFYFRSSEYGTTSYRPQLVITYK